MSPLRTTRCVWQPLLSDTSTTCARTLLAAFTVVSPSAPSLGALGHAGCQERAVCRARSAATVAPGCSLRLRRPAARPPEPRTLEEPCTVHPRGSRRTPLREVRRYGACASVVSGRARRGGLGNAAATGGGGRSCFRTDPAAGPGGLEVAPEPQPEPRPSALQTHE